MRRKIFNILKPSDKKDISHYVDLFIMTLIVLSVLDMILESEKSLSDQYGEYFNYFETVTVLIFSAEYLLRIWTCVEIEKYSHPFIGRIKFILSPMAIVDLLAILPFYLPFIGIDLRFLRVLRLFRIFRIFKLARYSRAFELIQRVLKDKKEELLVTLGFILIILLITSTLMYYLEREAQPDHFSSISKAIWWGVVTLTTVGYGDVYPITVMGKILGGVITLLGIGLIALPSGILASGYTEQITKLKEGKNRKP